MALLCFECRILAEVRTQWAFGGAESGIVKMLLRGHCWGGKVDCIMRLGLDLGWVHPTQHHACAFKEVLVLFQLFLSQRRRTLDQ